MYQKAIIDEIELSPDLRSYDNAISDLMKLLNPYSEMQITLSRLEEVLGVDRFLDRISENTFSVLVEILRESKAVLEEKCFHYKEYFQTQWNTCNVFNVLGHKLIERNDSNQICDFCTDILIITFYNTRARSHFYGTLESTPVIAVPI